MVSGRGTAIHGGNINVACVAGAFSLHGVVVAGASEAPVLRLLGEGWSKLPSPINTMRNSLVESSIMATAESMPAVS
jgi:hypothetical protein